MKKVKSGKIQIRHQIEISISCNVSVHVSSKGYIKLRDKFKQIKWEM